MLNFKQQLEETSSYRMGIFIGLSCAIIIFFSILYWILQRIIEIGRYLDYILAVFVIYLFIVLIMLKKRKF